MAEKSGRPEGENPGTPPRVEPRRRSVIQNIIAFKEAGILVIFFFLCIVLSIVSPYFLTVDNLTNVVRQFSMTAIISVGMTMVIITAGIDLSVGSTVGFAGCVSGWMLVDGYTIWFSIFVGLMVGILVGFVNGSLVVWIGLPPFIATLGTMGIARGLALVITRGYPLQPFPDEFLWIAQGYVGPIPVPVVIMIAVLVAGHIFLSRTTSGRYMYCIGSNPTAARLSGINVNKTLLMAYTITGFVSAISAVILISRLSSAQADNGTGWELDVIAATVIGGTSLAGGEGTVFGTLIGAAMMGVIRNALILLRVSVYWQTVVIGLVIVAAVTLDVLRQRSRTI